MMQITSSIIRGEILGGMRKRVAQIPTEIMVRSMSWEELKKRSKEAPLTVDAIDTGISSYFWDRREFWSIDTRVHMLMEGMYPCIPGWHHDDVQRTRDDGQPNYDDELRCEHAIFLLNAHVAPTAFAIGTAGVKPWRGQGSMYGQWHEEIEQHISNGFLEKVECPDSQWVYFDDRTWHTGVQSPVKFGHRLFIRIGMHYRMVDGQKVYEQPPSRANEIRRNAQVYMPVPSQGW